MSTTVKVLDAKKELATHSVKKDEVLVLDAQSNVNYQLINDQTGFGPQNIITKRQGDDLVIFLEDGNMNEDIIIKGYYGENGTSNMIVGLHENGTLYPYVPESGIAGESISVLAEEVSAAQALGGTELAVPFWAFNPWWIAGVAGVAGVAGIIALAASGGKSQTTPVSTKEVERLVKAAEAEKTNAEKALAELQAKIASNGGVVNPEDAANLVALNAQVEAAKEAANKALAQLGNLDGKAGFEARLAAVTPVKVPAVNDSNSNGKTDEQDLNDALSAAEAAKREYELALSKLGENVTLEDFARLSNLKATADSLRATAEKLVAEVPNNQADKPSLTERLEKLVTQDVPFVTDADSDGKHDAQVEVPQATDVLAAAEAAQALLEAKLKEFLGKNNLITDAEQKELIQLSKLAAEAKAKALPLVQGLPEGEGVPPTVTEAKADLTARLAKLNGIDIPAMNDSNADGLPDSPEDLVKYAEELSDKAAKLKADIEQEPTIEKAKADELALLIEQAASAQDKAKSAVEALPETDPKKEALAERAENATPPPPEGLVSNDLDNDGKLDTVEFSEADDALAALEKAVEAAKAALAKAEEDGVITPEEQAAIKAANKAVEDVKLTAYQAVKELPDLDPRKSDYVKREADLKAVKVPAVNADETGKPLTLDDLVAKSEEAEKAAQEFLENLPENPTLADIAKLEALNEEVNNAKLAAKEAIDKLEDPAVQEAFNTRLDDVNPVEVPKATDLSNIEDLVKKAEDAQDAYNQKLAELAKDGLISSEDLDALEPLKAALDTAKDATLDAIDELRTEQQENGDQPAYRQVIDNLEERAGLLGAELPQVNDFDNDGVSDTRERKQVQDLIEKAEKARADYDAAKQAAESNGLITPEEQAKLDELRQAIDSAKADSATAIEALKEGVNAPQAELDALNARLDNVESVPAEDVPAINDADSDGVADANSVNGQPSELDRVKALLKDAEEIRQKAADRLAEITKDGRPVTPAEQQEIVKLNEQLAQAKAKVQDALANLPATQESVVDDGNGETLAAQKSSLTDKEAALTALPVPAVTDLNGDGLADSVEDLVNAAKAAAEKAEALKKAVTPEEDSEAPAVITADQAKAINDAIELAEAAKKAAEDAINALPEDAPEKAEQTESLKAVEVPTAVEPNSVDNDNIPDEVELEKARELTQKAVDLAKQAEEKLAEITADGKVTPQEVEELTKLNEEVAKAKEAAKQALEELPKGVADEAKISDDAAADAPSLSALEQSVAPVAVPAPTADENGEPLSVEDLVEQAKQAEAEKALEKIKAKADSEGITPADIEKLEALNDKIEAAKQAAQKAIDELPNTDPAKDDFNDELKEVNPVEIPELVQSPAEEKVEDLLKEARDAEKALNDKLAELAQQEANDNVAKAEQALEEAQKAAEEATQATEEAKQATEEAKKALEADPTSEEAQQAVKDAEEAQKAAEEAQKAAEEAQQAAEEDKALADKNKALTDKAVEEGKPLPFISDETAKAAEEQAKALEDAKAKAEKAINALPDPKQQEQFTNQLADIDSEVPEVNDFDGDGISDNDELQAAKDQITAAEKAEADYEAEVARLSEGGISPEEKATLDAMRDDVLAKKADAQKAIDELKEGIGPKATDDIVQALNDRLAEVDPQAVPAVSDLDGDNISDDDEIQAAKDAEQAAKDALKAYTDELEKAKEGGVSPAELEKLEELKQAADEAKAAADKAKEALPASVGEEKATAAGIDDAAAVPDLPKVTDYDADGTSDDAEITDAQTKATAADTALQDYQAALDKANEDGLVTPDELKKLQPLKDAADAAKTAADDAKGALPAGVGADKANAAGIEDAAVVPDLPKVTDYDADGTSDDDEITDAQTKATEAAEALKNYNDKIAELGADGLTPKELEQLKPLRDTAEAAKAVADKAKADLPTGVGADKANAAGIDDAAAVPDLPKVTDYDGDGTLDDDEITNAETLATNAATKLQAYNDKLLELGEHYSFSDLEVLIPLREAAVQAKKAADTARNNLSTNVGEAKATAANISPTEDIKDLPTIDDYNGDGKLDATVKEGVRVAKEDLAKKLRIYNEALEAAKDNGGASESEIAELRELREAAVEAVGRLSAADSNASGQLSDEDYAALNIAVPTIPNLPEIVHAKPVKSDILVDSTDGSKTITGTAIDLVGKFLDGSTDTQPDSLSKVRIVSLPENGKLTLNGADVTAGQEIAATDVNNLTYTTNEPTYVGKDTFTYQYIDSGAEDNTSDVGTVYLNVKGAVNAPNILITTPNVATTNKGLVQTALDYAQFFGSTSAPEPYKFPTIANDVRVEDEDRARNANNIEKLFTDAKYPQGVVAGYGYKTIEALQPKLINRHLTAYKKGDLVTEDAGEFTVTRNSGGNVAGAAEDTTGVGNGHLLKTSTVVYLKKDQEVALKYMVDDVLTVSLGGQRLSGDDYWGGGKGAVSEKYMVTETGYYDLTFHSYNAYNTNSGNAGVFLAMMSVDGGNKFYELNTSNFDLFTDKIALMGQGIYLDGNKHTTVNDQAYNGTDIKQAYDAKWLPGSYDAVISNAGYKGKEIALNLDTVGNVNELKLKMTAVDTDGDGDFAETPDSYGKLLGTKDGVQQEVDFSLNQEIDLTGWDLKSLKVKGQSYGTYKMEVSGKGDDLPIYYTANDGSTAGGGVQEFTKEFNLIVDNYILNVGGKDKDTPITQTTGISKAQLQSAGITELYIRGSASDVIDLGRNGNTNNTLTDNGGTWTKKDDVKTDETGYKYDTYSLDGYTLYIDQTITQIV